MQNFGEQTLAENTNMRTETQTISKAVTVQAEIFFLLAHTHTEELQVVRVAALPLQRPRFLGAKTENRKREKRTPCLHPTKTETENMN